MSETVSLFFLLSAVCKKISKSSYQILNNQAVSFFRPYACGDWISPGQTLTFFFLPAVVFKEKHQKQLDFKTARPCFLFTSRCVCFKKKQKKTGLIQPDRVSPHPDGGQRGSGAREQQGGAVLFVLAVRCGADWTGGFSDILLLAWGGGFGHPGEA